MKLMIASDIHGSAYWCNKLMEAFAVEQPDKLVLLGDILYHGPRNDLPDGYAPKEVIAMLNPLKEKLFCVRGNCDTEVDQMVLDFPVLADYALLYFENRTFFITHGHKFNKDNLPPMEEDGILVYGHTHVPLQIVNAKPYGIWNPGSVSIPKENSPHSYLVLENGKASWKDIASGECYAACAY